MKKVKNLAVFNAVAYVIAFAVSMLSQTGVIGDNDMSSVSAKYESVFTPAGLTFSVWSLIYTALFAFCIYHLVKAFKEDIHYEANQSILKIGWLFILNNVSTAVWVFMFLNEQLIISSILILIQLVSLILINSKLSVFNTQKSTNDKLYTQFPLSIYLAWISIASIANISATLVGYGWNGASITPSSWAIIMIGIATLITLYMILVRKNIFFGMIVIWALYGIVLKRNTIDPLEYRAVINAAWTSIGLIAFIEVIQLIKLMRFNQHRSEISSRHGG